VTVTTLLIKFPRKLIDFTIHENHSILLIWTTVTTKLDDIDGISRGTIYHVTYNDDYRGWVIIHVTCASRSPQGYDDHPIDESSIACNCAMTAAVFSTFAMVLLFSLVVAGKPSSISDTHSKLNYTTHNTYRDDQRPVLDLTELQRPDNTIGTCLSLIALPGPNITRTSVGWNDWVARRQRVAGRPISHNFNKPDFTLLCYDLYTTDISANGQTYRRNRTARELRQHYRDTKEAPWNRSGQEPLPVDGKPTDWLRWIANSTKGRAGTEQ
jgi:hypothetical protein